MDTEGVDWVRMVHDRVCTGSCLGSGDASLHSLPQDLGLIFPIVNVDRLITCPKKARTTNWIMREI